MPLALVQRIDDAFLTIDEVKKVFHKAGLHELKAQNWPYEDLRKEATSGIDEVRGKARDLYGTAVNMIHFSCLTPVIVAAAARIVDLSLGYGLGYDFKQVIICAYPLGLLWWSRWTRKHPISPAIILAVLATTPKWFSGSFLRLGSSYFLVDAFFSPMALYLVKNISDRDETRWILIGFLLSMVYNVTGAAVTSTTSIPLVLLSGAVAFGFSFLVIIVIYQDGWWDAYFKMTPGTIEGWFVQHPISRLVESSVRYRAQYVVFYLNRLAQYFISIYEEQDRHKNSRLKHEYALAYDLFFKWNNSYVYSELERPTHIRLLKILAGKPYDPIKAEFIETEISESEPYEAISYVWGSNPGWQAITLDGQYMSITQSAFDILLQRRSGWHDRLLWIDQICINQPNSEEKASQVQMMKKIYERANRVIAYLGPALDAHLVQSHFAELYYRYHGLGFSFTELKTLYYREAKTAQWDALDKFFRNPWFRRIWIVQEAASAKELYVLYGDICLDWKYIERALDVLSDREMLEVWQPSNHFETWSGEPRHEAMMGLTNVNWMLAFRGDIKVEEKKITLAQALQRCQGFDATDPRDKVFALLGLLEDGSNAKIIPDYSETNTPTEVYTKTMKYLLTRREDPLYCLSMAGIGHHRHINSLPSWVPDWSLTFRAQPLDSRYSTGSRYPAKISFHPSDPSILCLEGESFDTITHLSDESIRRINWSMSAINRDRGDWFTNCKSLAKLHLKEPYFPAGAECQSLNEAVIRTMIGNQASYLTETPSTAQCLDDFEAVMSCYAMFDTMMEMRDYVLAGNPMTPEIKESFTSMLSIPLEEFPELAAKSSRFLHFASFNIGRKFCVTEKGRMGTVAPGCREGDMVCVLKGVRMPYVLRREGGDGRKRVCRLVGNAYVHGAMNGEIEVRKPELFVII